MNRTIRLRSDLVIRRFLCRLLGHRWTAHGHWYAYGSYRYCTRCAIGRRDDELALRSKD